MRVPVGDRERERDSCHAYVRRSTNLQPADSERSLPLLGPSSLPSCFHLPLSTVPTTRWHLSSPLAFHKLSLLQGLYLTCPPSFSISLPFPLPEKKKNSIAISLIYSLIKTYKSYRKLFSHMTSPLRDFNSRDNNSAFFSIWCQFLSNFQPFGAISYFYSALFSLKFKIIIKMTWINVIVLFLSWTLYHIYCMIRQIH